MKCSVCYNSSVFVCPCSKLYFCSFHLGVHLELEGNHPFEKLVELPIEKSNIYKKEILAKIASIEAFKSYIQRETKKLILFTEKCANSGLQKLDKILDSYLQIINSDKIYSNQIKEIQDLFKTECGVLRTGLNLDLSVKESYEIIMNCLPTDKWHDHKKVRYLEMISGSLACSTKIKISNDGKRLFRCKI